MNNELAELEKWNGLSRLNAGDKIKLTNGKIATFTKLNRTKFVASWDGQSYNCNIMMFVELVEKAQPRDIMGEVKKLKPGEPFYIEKGGNALLFYFTKLEGGRIIGKHPISDGNVRIDLAMYAGKVNK